MRISKIIFKSNWYSEERALIAHASETWQHIFDTHDTRSLKQSCGPAMKQKLDDYS